MKKILIIQNKFIGDVLASSVIANNLKILEPESVIHFFCYEPAVDVIQENPNIDHVISFNDKELKRFSVLKKYASIIKAENYDIVIDPYAKLQSRYIIWTSGAKQRISYDKPVFKHLYTDVIKQNDTTKLGFCRALEDRLNLLKPFSKDLSKLEYQFKIFLSDAEKQEGKEILKNGGVDLQKPIFMLGILGSSPSKSWSLKKMAKFIQYIQDQYDVNILFNYIPKQQNAVDEILQQLTSTQRIFPQIIGKSVREFLKIISQCDAYIGNEGGGINMSKALGKATFSIYSPHKFPEIWGCMENQPKHMSVHLRELKPEIYVQPDLKDLEKNAAKYYEEITNDFVEEKFSTFVNDNFPELPQAEISQRKTGISALLITKNEEKNIEAYLTEVDKYADEIIIVDSYSKDKTIPLAQKNPKVRVFKRKFDNFSSQRNFALSKAQNDWVTFFDADERLPQPLIAEILHTVKHPKGKTSFYIYRKFFVQNNRLKYSGWQNDKAIRLFNKKCCRYKEEYLVHEILQCEGKIGKLHNSLNHYSYKSFADYREKLYFYSQLRAKELYEKRVRPNFFHFYAKPAFRFLHHYIFRLGFLDGMSGFKMADLLARYVHKRYEYLEDLWNQETRK